MSAQKHLGKIARISIGSGGYQDAMFGISFTLSFGGCSEVSDFWGSWGAGIDHTKSCKWSEEQRQKIIADAFWRLANLMRDAKVSDTSKLIGIPIEVEIEGMILKSWRVLKEAL